MIRRLVLVIAGFAATASVAGCVSVNAHTVHTDSSLAGLHKAIAVLSPTAGNNVTGTVTFTQKGPDVTIVADVHGLNANAAHAWHIHEWGDISADDGTATGGHYNPQGHDHALPGTPARHAGDLGNLSADANGHAHQTIVVRNVTIGGALNPIVGRAIIIHAKMDDGGQPTGNAGPRIAQGVIGVDE